MNLCKNLNLKCFTFLQPLPLISGRNIKSHLNIKAHESKKKYWEEKYDHLKNTENIFDLNVTFTGSSCALGNGSTAKGILYYDSASKQILAMGMNTAKTDGFIALGVKP